MLDSKISDVKRFREIVDVMIEYELGYIIEKLGVADHLTFSQRIRVKRHDRPGPERLREAFEELGTTFIKFGQIMAERPDLVPQEYIEELEKLQDSAPTFDVKKSKEIIDEEIGLDNYSIVSDEPIAAASIAQVNRATLKSGEEVVIKVRRPDIKSEVKKDLEILNYIAEKAEKHSEWFQDIRLKNIVEEFSSWTKSELNLMEEARNAKTFQDNLQDESKVKVPDVYEGLTTEKALTIEYVDGHKVTDSEALEKNNISTEEIAKTCIRAGFKQIVNDGFFHADPHPSNFLVTDDGMLTYLDFGMMGRLDKKYRDKIDLLILYTAREESQKAAQTLIEMGRNEKNANLNKIEKKVEDKVMKIHGSSIKQARISEEFLDLFAYAGHQGLYLPLQLTIMAKNLVTMESIGLKVCPEFDPTEEYKSIGKKSLIRNNNPKELGESVILDMIANKNSIGNPISTMKNSVNRGNQVNEVSKESFSIELVPASLIISSPLVIWLSSSTNPDLLYLGVAQIILGILIYLKN